MKSNNIRLVIAASKKLESAEFSQDVMRLRAHIGFASGLIAGETVKPAHYNLVMEYMSKIETADLKTLLSYSRTCRAMLTPLLHTYL